MTHQTILPQGLISSTGRLFCVTLCFMLLLSTSLASVAGAAKIVFTPDNISVTAAPGEEVSVPLRAALTATSRPDAYARFKMLQTTGNLNRGWVSSVGDFSLDAAQPINEKLLKISIPATSTEGSFTAKFRTVWLRSNDGVAPVELSLNLLVEDTPSCVAPTFSDLTAQQTSVSAKNNKPFPVNFTGQITTPEGCPLTDAWYQLSDEYGELDEKGTLTVNGDGSFSTSITVLASRDGNDKNGRLYTVVFGAANEAGETESGATSIVIAHDNRKK